MNIEYTIVIKVKTKKLIIYQLFIHVCKTQRHSRSAMCVILDQLSLFTRLRTILTASDHLLDDSTLRSNLDDRKENKAAVCNQICVFPHHHYPN